MIEPAQIRAARALLQWNLQSLASRAKMSVNSISKIERELVKAHPKSLASLERVFEDAGIEFFSDSRIGKKGIRSQPQDIEIVYRDRGPLRGIIEHIQHVQGNIIVYGRGPARLDDVLKEYMTSIVSFLKDKPYTYRRISLISLRFPQASYLWLLFMQKLLSLRDIRERLHLKILEVASPPLVYVPIQIIGDNFVHCAFGELFSQPEQHTDHMFSVFIYRRDVCAYFTNFVLAELWNSHNCIAVNSRNINEYVNRYKTAVEGEYAEEGEEYIENAKELLAIIFENFSQRPTDN